jgi:hypothetical protein
MGIVRKPRGRGRSAVGTRCQAKGEDTADREVLVRVVVNCTVCKLGIVVTLYKGSINPIANPKSRLSIYLWLYSTFVGPWPLFSLLIFYTVGRTASTGDQLVGRPHRIAQRE